MIFRSVILFAVFGGIMAPARAGPLAISPTRVEIASGRRSTIVEITNRDTVPMDLQFRAYDWSQPDGGDQLTPTDDVVVSPAIVTVAPGATQIFRVLRTVPATTDRERSYRLRLNQIPQGGDKGIGINVEFLLPLFAGGQAGKADLRLIQAIGQLRIANVGARHVKIGAVQLERPGKPVETLRPPRTPYVLPDGTVDIPVDPARLTPDCAIVVQTEQGPIHVDVPILVARR